LTKKHRRQVHNKHGEFSSVRFFGVLTVFVAERHILQQNCLKKCIGNCWLGTQRRCYYC